VQKKQTVKGIKVKKKVKKSLKTSYEYICNSSKMFFGTYGRPLLQTYCTRASGSI
jgi:hypothetical protein